MKGEIIVLISFKENLGIIVKKLHIYSAESTISHNPFLHQISMKKETEIWFKPQQLKISSVSFYLKISTYYVKKMLCLYIA